MARPTDPPPGPAGPAAPPSSWRTQAGIGLGIALPMAVALLAMGRVPWCACGRPFPWAGEIWSPHNSQHLADPYSFSHLLHGLLFYAGFRAVLGADRRALRFGLALGLEALWELLENTPMVIERYREATISLEYYGDAVANSLGDLAACALGLWLARRLPWQASVALFVLVELFLAWWIRDGLLLNLLMLLHPIDAIRDWQGAIAPAAG